MSDELIVFLKRLSNEGAYDYYSDDTHWLREEALRLLEVQGITYNNRSGRWSDEE